MRPSKSTIVSLLLSIALILLILRSLYRVDSLSLRHAAPAITLDICHARMDLLIAYWPPDYLVLPEPCWTSDRIAPGDRWTNFERDKYFLHDLTTPCSFLGFTYRHGLGSSSGSEVPRFDAPLYALTIPLWFPLALTLIAPLLHANRRLRRHRRIASSLCPTCAYDLRAHSPGNKCPECGTPIPIHPSCPTASPPSSAA